MKPPVARLDRAHTRLAGLAGSAALALWLAATPALAAPQDDLLAFDARFIPALMATNVATPDAAAMARAATAVDRLALEWPALRARLADLGRSQRDRAGWEAMLVSIDRRVAEAGALLRQGRVQAAHEALEHVRPAMLAARRAAGIDYPIDRLVAFHDRMEDLVAAAPAAREGRLPASARDELVRRFAEARALWAAVERDRSDPQRLGLGTERAAQYARAVADESAALSRLSDALRGRDDAVLADTLASLKPPFARAYGAYGDHR
jgi:hypothetical protein